MHILDILEEEWMKLKDKFKINLLIITIIGFILRLLWITNIASTPVSDFAAYHNLAISVFKNETNSFLGFQGPGYPLILGWFYKLIGCTSIYSAKIFNLIISTITMIIILRVLIHIFHNKKYVYISYVMVILLPNYIAYNNIVSTEPLSLFLFSLIVLLQVSGKNTVLMYLFLGVVIGLASLVKPYIIIYPVIVSLNYYLKDKDLKETFKMLLVAQITCLCIIAPWTYRNYKVYNDFVSISYNDGYVMYLNNNNQNKGGWMSIKDVKMTDETLRRIKESGYTYEQAVSSFNPRLNKVFKEEAIKWVKKNPSKFAMLSLKRIKYTFFSGAPDVFDWSMNGTNTNNLFYTFVNNPIFRVFTNITVKILSSCGLIFVLIHALSILKALFVKARLIDYKISIPIFNIAFTVMLSIVYEGQPRYNFTTLLMFIICLCVSINSFKLPNNIIINTKLMRDKILTRKDKINGTHLK